MKQDLQRLVERMDAFSFDDPRAKLPFSVRLARENGWTLSYAARVIHEYKRFALLAVTAGHPVTPSDQVDQAWHLHLLYTESYWGEFCDQVLGQRLHHGPTLGGASEQLRFRRDYERTRESYRAMFGESPPLDVWPDVERRFGHDLEFARINIGDHWVIPKPRLRVPVNAPRVALILGLGLVGGACAVNPFDLRGPEFLQLFAVYWAISLGLSWTAKYFLLTRNTSNGAAPALDIYEIAYLTGGGRAVIQTVLANLLAERVLALDAITGNFSIAGSLLVGAPPLEKAVLAGMPSAPSDKRAIGRHLLDQARSSTEEIAKALESHGLLARWRAVVPFLLAVSAPIFGLIKGVIGQSRGKPIGYLILLCIASGWLAWRIFDPRARLTGAGNALLASVKKQHITLNEGRISAEQASDPRLFTLAVALFGLPALAYSEFPHLHGMFGSTFREGNRGAGDGGGCGGGGCGGGGCGGGGCGGCGGS